MDSRESKYCSITCLLFEYLDIILDDCVVVTPARNSCIVMDCDGLLEKVVEYIIRR